MTSFLADENVPPAIVEFLRQKGFDVKEALELGIPGTPDTMIMELTRKERRVLVTFDKHFANLLLYPVRNNAPLLPPGQRPSGPAAAAGLDFRIIPAGFNAPLGFESQRLEFLTGFTLLIVIMVLFESEFIPLYFLILFNLLNIFL